MLLKKSLRVRIIVIITAMVLMLFIMNAYISSDNAKTRFENLADEKYVATADYYAEMVNGWFNSNGAALMSLASYVDSFDGNISDMHDYFQEFVDEHEDISEAYFGMDDDSAVFGNYVPPADFRISTRGWYSAAKSANGIYYTEPYMDAITQSLCISMCCAADQGVVGMDLNLDTLTDIIPVSSDGYTIVATDQGTIVSHENPEFSFSDKTVQTLSGVLSGAYLKAMDDDSAFTDYNGTVSYITASEVDANNWTVLIVTPKSVYDRPVNDMILIFIVLTVIFCLITAAVVAFISFKITSPIVLMTKQLDNIVNSIRAGSGDLKARINYRSEDELGRISSGINALMEELNELIPKSKSAAGTVTGHSENLVGITGQLTQAISGISFAVEGIAKGAMQQATDVQAATVNVEQIGRAIDGVAATTGELDKIAKDMQKSSRESEQQIQNLQSSTDTMVDGIGHITEQIKDTSRVVDRINERVAAISKIASQTNLLSLNASIEAARAGEMGKSFAVVAQEIGTLAVNSAEAAESIKEEMDELLQSSQTTVNESGNLHELTITQQNVLNDTTQSIQSLLSQIDTTITHINNIENDVNNCVSAKTVIVDAMASLSAISEQNAASSQETSATTIEINSTIGDLSNSANDLNSVAAELNESLNIFI